MLIAGHAWDVHGVKRAGLKAAWVKRQDAVFSKVMDAPDVSGADLGAVVDAILSSRTGSASELPMARD